MRFILFFVFLLSCQTKAQEVLFEGNIYDSKTKQPIPYVNLSFLNTLKGTSTDEEGRFFLDVPKSYLEKRIHLSSLGYKDTIVAAKNLYENKRLALIEESFELEEVVVSENMGNSDVLNPILSYSLTSGFSSSSTPWVLALYFPNIGAQPKSIDKVTIFFQKSKGFNGASSKFRLRIYDIDGTTKKPNKDILRKSIILVSDEEKGFVSVDLSALKLKIPDDGIYIGLEWLFVAHNWYKKIEKHPLTHKLKVEDRFAPTFGGVYNKNQNYKTMVYGMGEWTNFTVKSKDRAQNFIPAISLKITKK